MTEVEENQGVTEQETATPVEATESQSIIAQEVPKKPEAGTQEYNWRRMEQKVQELERNNHETSLKNQELARRLEERINPPKETSDELEQLDDEDLPSVGYSKKLAKQAAREIYQEEEKKKADEQAKREREALPGKVKKQYEDYDQVVTNENIEKLVQEDPDLEHDIRASVNPYARAYKEIKKSEFYKTMVSNSQNKERIESNNQKPVSSNSIGNKGGPLSQANAFATQSNDDLWAEMQNCSKGAASAPELR